MSHPNIGVLMPSCRPTLTAEAFDGLRNFPQGVAFVVLIAQKFTADDWSKVIADHDPGVPVLLHWQPNGAPVYPLRWATTSSQSRRPTGRPWPSSSMTATTAWSAATSPAAGS
jgi:hypothetical protein